MAKSTRHQLPQPAKTPINLSPPAAPLTLASTNPIVTDLTHLVELLKKIAADRAADERLTKKERDQWVRQGEILFSSVAELDAILIDPQYENARDRLLGKLFEAVSACFIAARVKEDRLKTANATAAKKKQTKIVVEEAEKLWHKNPNFRGNERGSAENIDKDVNERIKAEGPLSKRDKKLIAAGQSVKTRHAIEMILRRWLSTARSHDRA